MGSGVLFIRLLLISYACFRFVHAQKNNDTRYLLILNNKRLDHPSKKIIRYDLNELQCLVECNRYTECHSVNRHLERLTCEVMFDITEDEKNNGLIDANGWRYYEKSTKKLFNIKNINWMHHPSMVIMSRISAKLPEQADVGRMYRGGIHDNVLPSDTIVTWENIAGHSGGSQWIGHSDSVYASKKILINILVKFVQKIPPVGQVNLKVYGDLYSQWVLNCRPNQWCEESFEIQNKASGDYYNIILLFDSVNDFQTIRIGYFDIKFL